ARRRGPPPPLSEPAAGLRRGGFPATQPSRSGALSAGAERRLRLQADGGGVLLAAWKPRSSAARLPGGARRARQPRRASQPHAGEDRRRPVPTLYAAAQPGRAAPLVPARGGGRDRTPSGGRLDRRHEGGGAGGRLPG